MKRSPDATTEDRATWYDTIVIGGGQAGLAVGHHLAELDIDFMILDGGARVGQAWRDRWDALRLTTPARDDGLPGMPFPAAAMTRPTKDEFADYLERYADRFDLPMRMNTRVASLRHADRQFILDTNAGRWVANNVVVATGPYQRPRVPAFASSLDPRIHQLHSSAHTNAAALPQGSVLVVGASSSGAQIALELSRTLSVTLAGREVGHRGELAASAVQRVGRITGVRDGLPCAEATAFDVRTVVWATGFAPDYRWMQLPVFDADGAPAHTLGVSDLRGLYFVGLPFQSRPTSALIAGVGADARYIAGELARRG